MHFSKGLFVLTFASIALIAGCGQDRQPSQTSTDKAAATPAIPAPEPATAGLPAWVAGVRQEEMALGQSIEQGQLAEVHDRAIKLNTLLKPVAEQAGSLAPEQQQQLNGHLSAATRLADELHSAGDAGDLMKAKAKFQEFQTHLRAIEGVFGVSTP